MYFSRSEYEQRWQRVQAGMKKCGYETLVVWQRSGGSYDRAGDVYWLTNYASLASGQEPTYKIFPVGRGFAACIFCVDREPELFIAEPLSDTDTSRIVCGAVYYDVDLPTRIARRLLELRPTGPVAYASNDVVPVMFDERLRRAAPELEWVSDNTIMVRAQNIKSSRDIEAYRAAGEIATRALNAVMEALVDGEPESEAAARGGAIIMRAGGGFQRICMNHGPKSERVMWSDPLYGYSTTAPKPGDMVRGWVYGPIFQGYWLDPGRTAVCGRKPTAAQKACIEGTNSIVAAVIEKIRPGVTPRQVAIAATEVARTVGYFDQPQAGALWGLVGHGVGPYFTPPIFVFPEAANFSDPNNEFYLDEPIQAGMVLTSEAFLTHTGVGTGACEQILIVTETGTELISKTPLVFW